MKMNLTTNQTNPSPTPTVWSIELPQRLELNHDAGDACV